MKKILLVTFFIALFVFCSPFQVKAELAPGIFITDSHLNSINGSEIQGEFTVTNDEQYYLSDLNYEVKLLEGNSFENFKLIDVSVNGASFYIPPKATITKTFTYIVPKNIISDNYTLRTQIITERGTELGWKDMAIYFPGGNKFLDIDSASSKVINGKQEGLPLEGINVLSTDSVVGYLKVKNPGDSITVVPEIKIFQRQFNMSLVQQYQYPAITFAKGETKDVNLTLPKINTPDSYLGEVKFYQNNEQVSGIQYFRWVVEGQSGKILYIKADKDYYKAGDNINLTVQTVGPADTSDAGQGKLEITIIDKSGNIIAVTSKDVPLNFDLTTSAISIPVKTNLTSPEVDAKLTKDGKVLDERIINLPVFSPEAKQLDKKISDQEKINMYLNYFLLPTILVLIFIAGLILYKFKFKKNNKKK